MTREHAYELRDMLHKASASLSDADAIKAIEFYAWWEPNTEYSKDTRLRYPKADTGVETKLWRVREAHKSQAQYPPSIYTAALYTEIERPGQGDTPDNPIPYNNNMELIEGKYYSQFEVVYVCTRSTGIPVYNNLADLVGLYVSVVQ